MDIFNKAKADAAIDGANQRPATRPDSDYLVDAKGAFILDGQGNKQLTKKAKQKDADEKRRAKRKEAFDNLMAMAKSALESGAFNEADAKTVKQALFDLRPLRSNEPTARITVQKMLSDLFGDKKVVTGAEAYAAFREGKLSTPDVRKLLTLAIKTGKPEDRLWIEYDAKNDNYNLVARGAATPMGWMGYTPADAAVAQ